MGFWVFSIFALKCFDVLTWPLFALGYPLCASIQAIETNSDWHTRKLVTYWVLFSLISLFEHAFVKLLEWVPFWSYTKLMIICCLVIPHFDGAFYIYKHLVHPCLSMDLQILVTWFNKWKDFLLKRDDILAKAERYVKENGPEALEKLIAGKEVQKEWACAICQVTTQSETTMNLHLQGWRHQAACEKLKAKDQVSKTVEVTEKKEVTEAQQVNQSEPNLAQIENRTLAPVENKEATIAVEAGGEHPQTPALKEVQKEWTCAICQIAMPSETTLNLHLQEKRHQAACEKLKAINQASKTVEVAEKKEVAEAMQVNQSEPKLAHIENNTFLPVEIKETTVAVKAGGKHRYIPSFRKVLKECACPISQVITQSETNLNLHLQGWQHQATCEKLKAKTQASKTVEVTEKKEVTEDQQVNHPEPNLAHIENRIFAPVEIKETTSAVEAYGEHPHIPAFKEVQNEWTCAICQITTPSEITLNLHLQEKQHQRKERRRQRKERRHQAACEKLKAKNQVSNIVEVTEKKEVTEAQQVNQSEPNLAHIENKTFAPVEIKETPTVVEAGGKHPQIPPFKEVQNEWICAICQITTPSETTLNLHLQGKRHQKKERQQAACDKLKANNQASESKIGPASASNKSDLPEEEKCVSTHKITSQEAKRSDLPKEVAEKCASRSGLKCKVIATHEVNKYDVVKEEEEKCVSNNGLDYKHNSKAVRLVVWSPPAEGWFKLNINGSYLGNPGQASAGGIIRDQWGNWIRGFSRSLWVTHSLVAELWGLRDGLSLALNFNLKYLELEFDAAMAVELIRNCFDPLHPLNALLYECRLFLSKLDRYTITLIPREANYCADALSREAYNLDVSFKVYDLPPGSISHLIYADFVGVNQPKMYSV